MAGNHPRGTGAGESGRGGGLEDTGNASDPSAEMMRLINGYQVSQALHVAATLGVADHLKDGPQRSDALARACGAHPGVALPAAARPCRGRRLPRGRGPALLAHAARRHALRAMRRARVANTPAGSGRPACGGPGATCCTAPARGKARRGSPAGWTPGPTASQHPEERAVFDAAMTALSRAEARAVIDAYDFSRCGCIVDVGGGEGHLLKAILLACPAAHGILFDRPQVAVSAGAGVRPAGLAQRCQAVGGDFFRAVPGGGDAYVMKSVLHDWDDARGDRDPASLSPRDTGHGDAARHRTDRGAAERGPERQVLRPEHARAVRRPGAHARGTPGAPEERRLRAGRDRPDPLPSEHRRREAVASA